MLAVGACFREYGELFLEHDRADLDAAVADIRSWVLVSIISGHGLYDSPLPRARLAGELIAAARRVIDGPPADVPVPDPSAAEQDKADLLVAAVNRLHEWRALEMTRAMRAPCPDEQVLPSIVRGYVRVAIEASELLAVWLTERPYLPDVARERFDRIEADYVSEWQRWLSVARPDLPDAVATSLVKTTKTIIDDCARIQRLQRLPIFPAELTTAALATLGLPAGSPSTA
jgi:hypothetical protein